MVLLQAMMEIYYNKVKFELGMKRLHEKDCD